MFSGGKKKGFHATSRRTLRDSYQKRAPCSLVRLLNPANVRILDSPNCACTLANMSSSECETDKPSKSSMLALPLASTASTAFPTVSQGQHMASTARVLATYQSLAPSLPLPMCIISL